MSQSAIDLLSRIQQRGLSLSGTKLLLLLKANRTQSISQLVPQMGICAAAMTGVADKLEGDGLIQRESSLQDRRRIGLSLTGKGDKAVAEIVKP